MNESPNYRNDHRNLTFAVTGIGPRRANTPNTRSLPRTSSTASLTASRGHHDRVDRPVATGHPTPKFPRPPVAGSKSKSSNRTGPGPLSMKPSGRVLASIRDPDLPSRARRRASSAHGVGPPAHPPPGRVGRPQAASLLRHHSVAQSPPGHPSGVVEHVTKVTAPAHGAAMTSARGCLPAKGFR